MAYLILDEKTQQYLAEEYDAETIANAAANRHARTTGHDASVWVGDRHDATNTGYYAEAGHRGYEVLRTIGVIRSDGVEKELEVVQFDEGRLCLHDPDDKNFDAALRLEDDSDTAIHDALSPEWDIIE